jgi:hypothetical protein
MDQPQVTPRGSEVKSNLARAAIGLSGVAAVAVALLLYASWPPIVELLPFAPSTTLTNQFLGSVALAYAAAALWIAWSRELAAFAGAGLTVIAVSAGVAIGRVTASSLGARDVVITLGALIAIAVSSVLVWWTAHLPFRDRRPMARYVRVVLVVFTLILVAAGLPIALAVPNVLPWRLGSSGQALVGWIFLADALYFAYGAVRPRWGNAVGQLLAFLAYDLALILPMLLHVGTVDPAQSLSLVAYVAVLILSGAIAAYAFTIDPRTRLGSRDSGPHPETTTGSPAG